MRIDGISSLELGELRELVCFPVQGLVISGFLFKAQGMVAFFTLFSPH